MTGVIILSVMIGIILLIVLLLNVGIRASIKLNNGKLEICAKYLFFTLYRDPEKEKPERKKRKSEKSEENEPQKSENDTEKSEIPHISDNEGEISDDEFFGTGKFAPRESKKKRKSLEELIDGLSEKKKLFSLIWELCGDELKKIIGKIHIDGVKIDFAAANEDAYECAMLYGYLNAAVYNAVAWLKCFFKVNIKSVNIDCLFNHPSSDSRYNGEAVLKLTPAAILNGIVIILISYLKNKDKYRVILDTFLNKEEKSN